MLEFVEKKDGGISNDTADKTPRQDATNRTPRQDATNRTPRQDATNRTPRQDAMNWFACCGYGFI
ncbi:MAG: hypothetical protein ABSG78_23990 [Verrucomicrobiota bacterium]